MSEREQLRQRWVAMLKNAVQLDGWGQFLEAGEEYTKLAMAIGHTYGENILSSAEKDVAHRIVLCLSARVQAINSLADSTEGVSAQDIRLLENTIEQLFNVRSPTNMMSVNSSYSNSNMMSFQFPIPPHKFQNATPILPAPSEICCAENTNTTAFQSTHAALSKVNGTVVVLKLDKVGLKDAETYIDPFVSILVVDWRGSILDNHDTPNNIATKLATHVVFGYEVFLRISLEEMQRNQCSIFFEFKHYKPKKRKISTRCWSFMELNELRRDEENVLEIYHKPTDLRKKKLNLHSVKKLYMHVTPSFMS